MPTANLGLDYLAESQAQKHVTLNGNADTLDGLLGALTAANAGGIPVIKSDGSLEIVSLTGIEVAGSDGARVLSLADIAGPAVLGKDSGTGEPAAIAAGSDGQYLRRSAGSLGFGAIAMADLPSLIQQEQTTWTPSVTALTPGDLVFTPSTAVGKATKLSEDWAVAMFWVSGTVTHSTASGRIRITGAPYAVAASSLYGNAFGPLHTLSGITISGSHSMTGVIGLSGVAEFGIGSRANVGSAAQNAITNITSGATFTAQGSILYPTA